MHICISIALTALALAGGMYLLAKARAEMLGGFFRFVAWSIIVITGVCLLCQAICGTFMLMHHVSEYHGGGHHEMHKEIIINGEHRGDMEEMEDCGLGGYHHCEGHEMNDEHGGGCHKDGRGHHCGHDGGDEHHEHEMKTDTIRK